MDVVNIYVPLLFIALICLEALLSLKENSSGNKWSDMKINLKIAALGLVVNLVLKAGYFTFFTFLYQYRFIHFKETISTVVLLFILSDLNFYFFHWLGHKSRFFWALHVIHHSSTTYNFTTALRMPFTNAIFRYGMLSWMVLIGFSPLTVLFIDSIILSITFLQHTETVGKLGWLEYVFNTPSHHRVHHAKNEKYLDKNLGGVLIIWDKSFGTFAEEIEKPIYGITKPFNDKSVFNIITHELKDLFRDISRYTNIFTKIRIFFGPPSWTPVSRAQNQFRLNSTPIKSLAIFLLILFFALNNLTAQYLDSGKEFEKKGNYKMAVMNYEKEIASNKNNPEGYWRLSLTTAKLAGLTLQKNEKFRLASNANKFASKGLTLEGKNIQSRLALIVSLGLMSEASTNPTQKLSYAKVIRNETEKLLSQDSLFAPGYYILGKWHYELAKLNWVERLACNSLFGGMPGDVSFGTSLKCLEKAIRLQPDYILFHYARAACLYQTSRFNDAMAELKISLDLPIQEPEDRLRKEKCLALLELSKNKLKK
jgi:sterol desaturase/sphingolipid hydroxylase (fatty acid hydroxylase superfamily)/tetratricopeptide (TPR) repeat protein